MEDLFLLVVEVVSHMVKMVRAMVDGLQLETAETPLHFQPMELHGQVVVQLVFLLEMV